MSHLVPERGRITDALIAYLRGHAAIGEFGLLIGDGDPPDEAGWPAGTPQEGAFVASSTVRTAPAVPLHREGVRSRHSSWRCRYGLRTIGGVRAQADAAADVVRLAVAAYRDLAIETPSGNWDVQDAVFEQLGGVDPQGTQDQTRTWQVDDVVDLWIVRA